MQKGETIGVFVIKKEKVDEDEAQNTRMNDSLPVLIATAIGALLGPDENLTVDEMYNVLKADEVQATEAIRKATECGLLVKQRSLDGPALLTLNTRVAKVLKNSGVSTRIRKQVEAKASRRRQQYSKRRLRIRKKTRRERRRCCCGKGYCTC